MNTLRPHIYPALKVALIYAIVGGLWILFSDGILQTLVPDPAAQAEFQTWKGWFYVLITALLLFGLVLRQIHSSTKAARVLQNQKDAFNIVFDKLPLAVHGYDHKSRTVFWNEACVREYGHSRSEALASTQAELMLPAQKADAAQVADAAQGQAMRSSIVTMIRKDGTLAKAHSTRVTLTLPGGDKQFFFIDIPMPFPSPDSSPAPH